jgi:hypothetical protein
MWRSKKFIIVTVLVAVLLLGGIGGIAFAQADNGSNNQSKAQGEDILGKVCAIYQQKTGVAIDQEALKAAFAQAQSELQKEREQARLQDLVKQGKITQEQADSMQKWWDAKPDVPFGFGPAGPGGFGHRGCGGPPPSQSGTSIPSGTSTPTQ